MEIEDYGFATFGVGAIVTCIIAVGLILGVVGALVLPVLALAVLVAFAGLGWHIYDGFVEAM